MKSKLSLTDVPKQAKTGVPEQKMILSNKMTWNPWCLVSMHWVYSP